MLAFAVKRFLIIIPLLFLISATSFIILQAPPGDYVTQYMARVSMQQGFPVTKEEEAALRRQYGLDQPIYMQYIKWLGKVLRGDFGLSTAREAPVNELVKERLLLTVSLSVVTILFVWTLAIPIGVISAVKQYSIYDYVATFAAYIGVGTPNFLLALAIMWIVLDMGGGYIGGLFSTEYIDAPWSWGRVLDVLKRIWVPAIILGTDGMAGLTRIVRANMLDEMNKPYVLTAISKGLPMWRVIMKYPLRTALNPFFSGIGYALPQLFSGATILGVVLGLPIIGPLILEATLEEDLLMAGSLLFILAGLTLIGTLISDLILAWADPRIRIEG
jgi:peptide/nickel transport system permease protein